MTPAARLAAAASILDTLDLSRLVEPQLKAWARKNRYAGSGDRRAIADRVYNCLRRKRSSAAFGGGPSGRALVLGSLCSDDELALQEIDDLCSGGYGLEPLSDIERATLSTPPTFKSVGEQFDWPDWLLSETEAVFGEAMSVELDALRQRAPLDLRVNSLRATRDEARAALLLEGIASEPLKQCDTALRVAPATPILHTTAYRDGLVEPQDAASQAVAMFAAAAPDQTVLDYCAGAGGKTLALAAIMRNRGTLIAHDVEPGRMAALPERAERCGATIIKRRTTDTIKPSSCDAVLVDAPCSGSGSWRRDPLGKWRLTPDRLADLHLAQRDALTNAASFVRAAGSLTYATCSILPSENRDQAQWFLDNHTDFSLEAELNLWPARDQTDGFFAARFRRVGEKP